jgi:L-aspartate oxidase
MTTLLPDRIEPRRALIVGSGVAGLTTALALGDCTVLTKTENLTGGSSAYAQGGIAAPVGPNDSPELHAEDTVEVSGGIADEAVVRLLTTEAPDRIHWLLSLGAQFDRTEDGDLALGREAGHGKRRILHADGDATGPELMRTLVAAVRDRPDIEVLTSHEVIDLVMAGGRVAGVLARDASGSRVIYTAGGVVLATGGIGQIYSRTTNPVEVTGDGIAMAVRAGAVMADMEFVQFHPTALAVDAPAVPLLTEALRGEGATLIDEAGSRFMPEVHPDAELAPRDVVARAIWNKIDEGHKVFLDSTTAVGAAFPDRFPTVFGLASEHGFDPRIEPLPVTPAVHYFMGGIKVDAAGRSSVPGLWAVGECSSTGVHGANRLASNSLLEGLVFGARVADAVTRESVEPSDDSNLDVPAGALDVTTGDPGDVVARLQWAMSRWVGIVRDEHSLRRALHELKSDEAHSHHLAVRNLITVGRVIVDAARRRTESRGGHYRSDFPDADEAQAVRSTIVAPRTETVTISTAVHQDVA